MRILIVAATGLEVAPLVASLGPLHSRHERAGRYTHAGHEIDVLETGVGMVATANWCARLLATEVPFDLALNLGVCGSFDPALTPGRVVHIVEDRFSELGAEDGENFLGLSELGLLGPDTALFADGALHNREPPSLHKLDELPPVRGITVNTAHGDPRSIAAIQRRFAPQVESMEGAAFMYACLTHGVPFAQVRAVSNVVERRNREHWKMAEAIAALNETARRLLEAP
jgi:futalosine hydrolase